MKDQFLTRRDQMLFIEKLQEGDSVYILKVFQVEGLRIIVTNFMKDHKSWNVGIVTKRTKIIFRTCCARQLILVSKKKNIVCIRYNEFHIRSKLLRRLWTWIPREKSILKKYSNFLGFFSKEIIIFRICINMK